MYGPPKGFTVDYTSIVGIFGDAVCQSCGHEWTMRVEGGFREDEAIFGSSPMNRSCPGCKRFTSVAVHERKRIPLPQISGPCKCSNCGHSETMKWRYHHGAPMFACPKCEEFSLRPDTDEEFYFFPSP